MDNWENLLDKDVLQANVKYVAMFILNFECLKDFVISQPKEFYGEWDLSGEEMVLIETEDYKKAVRSLHKNIEDASLLWFKDADAITEDDISKYHIIRKRRNELVHEFLGNLNKGFGQGDLDLFRVNHFSRGIATT